MKNKTSGFSLIELMAVVTILTILTTIAIPQFAAALQKSREGSAKGDLGALRSALAVYNADTEGQFPAALSELKGTYLPDMPLAKGLTYHADSAAVSTQWPPTDAGGWTYHNSPVDPLYGTVTINCTHQDSAGRIWAQY